MLVTRFATSETFGIHPIALQLAERYAISTTPRKRITGIPLHCDMPVTTLTRLSTRPVNRHRYLQIRQRTVHPVTPVHTYQEYLFFKHWVSDAQFRKKTQSTPAPHEAHKLVDFDQFTIFWNRNVYTQDRAETDSNKRLYYKLPSHLERHYKRTLLWKSERATVMMGSNAAALKPFKDLLASNNDSTVELAARELPGIPLGEEDRCFNQNGKFKFSMYYNNST
jgi:hypothetical protein